LESLMIALIGGIIGCLIAWIVADGRETTGNLASRNGPGGKRLALKIEVDAQVWAMSLCFALVMGRIGGLVPAMSAMRVKILDSLK
jgi:putative ABC transport system permease protein